MNYHMFHVKNYDSVNIIQWKLVYLFLKYWSSHNNNNYSIKNNWSTNNLNSFPANKGIQKIAHTLLTTLIKWIYISHNAITKTLFSLLFEVYFSH